MAVWAERTEAGLGRRGGPGIGKGGEGDDVVIVSPAAGFPHGAGRWDELPEVLVGSDHEGFDPTRRVGLVGEGPDNVVGLVAVELQDGDAEGRAEAFETGEGDGEILGHLFPVGLVGGEHLGPGGGSPGVEDAREVSMDQDSLDLRTMVFLLIHKYAAVRFF